MTQTLRILKEKSFREIVFRINRIFKKKMGILQKSFPINPPEIQLPSLEEFRSSDKPYFFADRNQLSFHKYKSHKIKDTALRILKGEMLFFSKEWINLGKDYDWVTNPITNYTYDRNIHWSIIETLDKKAGDIKYIWEKSRFSYFYHIIRYDYHFDLDHSDFIINEIISWIEANPINCGPNYVCSQEISLRINNWLFALFFYKHSQNLTPEKWDKIIQSIYWQISHVYSNINFSRIAVRNNHAVTETLTLYICGLLFPEMHNSKKWKINGKKWFEQEINYQFETDGTYLQESMNYQRVVTQLLSIGISLSNLSGEEFSQFVYDKAYNSLNFLYQCMEKSSGWLPNYGSNDGALFFPLSSSDYRDFRPQLDALNFVLTSHPLLDNLTEESLWLAHPVKGYPKLVQKEGLISFDKSGFYLIREADTFTFMKCGNFKKKGVPDQLHLDIWNKGENIIFDGGTYRYNASPEDEKYFRGSESHNTVMIDKFDQMLKGPRFMWFYPPRVISVNVSETSSEFVIDSNIEMFKHVGKSIFVQRIIRKKKGQPQWIIQDSITNLPKGKHLRQLWHIMPNTQISINSTGDRRESTKEFSFYYGVKEPCLQIEFNSHKDKITTSISL